MNTLKNERGSMIIEVLLGVIILGVIGTAIYFYVSHSSQTASPSPSISSTTGTDGAKATPVPQKLVLKIKELGIQLPLTAEIADLTYSYNSSITAAGLSTTKLLGLDSGCTADNSSIGAVQKVAKTSEQAKNSALKIDVGNGSVVIYEEPEADCVNNPDKGATVGEVQAAQAAAVKAAFASATVIK